jgi:DNA-binding transcriptional ArsR family regulator
MTPVVVPDTDQLRSMITFRTSTLYELFFSLGALQSPGHRHQDRAQRVRSGLPPDLLEELEFFYTRFERGILLMELAIDYREQHDVEGFFEYLEQMDIPHFLFYALGRLAPAEEMAKLQPRMDSLLSIIPFSYPDGDPYQEGRLRTGGFLELLADPNGYKVRLLELWRRYWELCFKEESKEYHQIWDESIKEKSRALSGQDASEFLERLAGGHELPEQVPAAYATEEVILVPSYFGPHHLIFFGYGSTTIIYDCQITEDQRAELERLGEETVAVGKALGDKTRLELLKWIVRDSEIYGQALAKRCHLSQPSVSRHLRILKEAGIIQERPVGNHISYEVRRERLEKLSEQLIDYLYE